MDSGVDRRQLQLFLATSSRGLHAQALTGHFGAKAEESVGFVSFLQFASNRYRTFYSSMRVLRLASDRTGRSDVAQTG